MGRRIRGLQISCKLRHALASMCKEIVCSRVLQAVPNHRTCVRHYVKKSKCARPTMRWSMKSCNSRLLIWKIPKQDIMRVPLSSWELPCTCKIKTKIRRRCPSPNPSEVNCIKLRSSSCPRVVSTRRLAEPYRQHSRLKNDFFYFLTIFCRCDPGCLAARGTSASARNSWTAMKARPCSVSPLQLGTQAEEA